MAWFSRERSGAEGSGEGEKRVRTEGLWLKCEGCSQIIWKKTLEENGQVCPQCEYHFRVDARTRLTLLFDGGAYEEVDASLTSTDPLELFRFQRPTRCAWPRCRKRHRCRMHWFQAGASWEWKARQHLRDGIEIRRRQHGHRGRRRKSLGRWNVPWSGERR